MRRTTTSLLISVPAPMTAALPASGQKHRICATMRTFPSSCIMGRCLGKLPASFALSQGHAGLLMDEDLAQGRPGVGLRGAALAYRTSVQPGCDAGARGGRRADPVGSARLRSTMPDGTTSNEAKSGPNYWRNNKAAAASMQLVAACRKVAAMAQQQCRHFIA